MEIKKICVLRAGTIRYEIARVCAQSSFQVSLQDITEEFAQGGLERINRFLQGSIERKRITKEEADAVLGRTKGTTNLEEAVKDADLIIEAIPEDMEPKKGFFKTK